MMKLCPMPKERWEKEIEERELTNPQLITLLTDQIRRNVELIHQISGVGRGEQPYDKMLEQFYREMETAKGEEL